MTLAWVYVFSIALWMSLLHAYQLAPRHAPLISQQDLDAIPWIPRYMKLTRGEHMYIYHNYTSVETNSGSESHRYLGREVIPHYRRVLRTLLEPAEPGVRPTKRGFIANPNVPPALAQFLLPGSAQPPIQLRYLTWNWKRDASGCAVRIPLCFQNPEAQQRLRTILINAVAKWHNALGPKRGVEFFLVPGDPGTGAFAELCRNANGQWRQSVHPDTVEIRYVPGYDKSYNGLGWKPGREAARMRISYGLDLPHANAGMRNTYHSVTMAHELGHVLVWLTVDMRDTPRSLAKFFLQGLEHEHQRYDAPQHIRYFWNNVRDIGALDGRIATYNARKGTQLTRDMVLSDRTWDFKMKRELGFDAPRELNTLVPFVQQNDPIELIDFEQVGPFDWDSIMLYDSWTGNQGGTTKNDAVMRKRSDDSTFGNFWFMNNLISDGDVVAVKRIYPDVPDEDVPGEEMQP